MSVVQSLSPCIIEGTVEGGWWQLIKSHREPPDAFQAGSPMQKCSKVDREAPAGRQEKGLPLGRRNFRGIEKDRVHQ